MKNDFRVKLNGEYITYRKWKGKDKKNFVQLFDDEELSLKKTLNTLVDQVIETSKPRVFSQQEYRYLLSVIRSRTLGDEMEVQLDCSNCEKDFVHKYKISEVIQPVHSTLDEFENEEIKIKFGPIRNKDAYFQAVEENPEMDIFFRIQSVNDRLDFTLEELIDIFDDLDLDTIDEIVKYYEDNKFRVNDLVRVKCSHCEHEDEIEFDELPGFFPESWFQEAIKKIMSKEEQEEFDELNEDGED